MKSSRRDRKGEGYMTGGRMGRIKRERWLMEQSRMTWLKLGELTVVTEGKRERIRRKRDKKESMRRRWQDWE